MSTGTVYKETQDLQEELRYRQTLAAFAYRAKLAVNVRDQGNVAQVQGKDTQISSAGQLVDCRQNSADFLLLFLLIPVIFCHEALHLMGCVVLNGNYLCYTLQDTTYPIG